MDPNYQQPALDQPIRTPPTNPPTNSGSKLPYAAGIIIVLVVLGTGYYFLAGANSPKISTTTNPTTTVQGGSIATTTQQTATTNNTGGITKAQAETLFTGVAFPNYTARSYYGIGQGTYNMTPSLTVQGISYEGQTLQSEGFTFTGGSTVIIGNYSKDVSVFEYVVQTGEAQSIFNEDLSTYMSYNYSNRAIPIANLTVTNITRLNGTRNGVAYVLSIVSYSNGGKFYQFSGWKGNTYIYFEDHGEQNSGLAGWKPEYINTTSLVDIITNDV
jgi:hypothetical protein